MRGAALARSIREEVRREVELLSRGAAPPRLRVILMGADPASETYVAAKTRAADEAGITAETVHLSAGAGEKALLDAIDEANEDDHVDGVLVQLPLPSRAWTERAIDRIDPLKDVDGLHPENVGLLHQGRPRFVPCTPAGILALLDAHEVPIAGTRATVIGRSEIVGKPIAALLTARNATVTICHSLTRELPGICREADILVAAVGRPGLVRGDWIKDGAVIVDVGVNRVRSLEELPEHVRSERLRETIEKRGEALIGDVAQEEVAAVAGWVTPVPGGVGPLTVAMLLKNTLAAARRRRGGSDTR
jgi:methylenetetrahydrofolate dehydrogenase (NADP+)/methenyltetrahydrofolate cyclohydrolase